MSSAAVVIGTLRVKEFLVTIFTFNTELNELRKIVCLRKFEVSVEKKKINSQSLIKLAEHGIH